MSRLPKVASGRRDVHLGVSMIVFLLVLGERLVVTCELLLELRREKASGARERRCAVDAVEERPYRILVIPEVRGLHVERRSVVGLCR